MPSAPRSAAGPVRRGILGCGVVTAQKSGPASQRAEASTLVPVLQPERLPTRDSMPLGVPALGLSAWTASNKPVRPGPIECSAFADEPVRLVAARRARNSPDPIWRRCSNSGSRRSSADCAGAERAQAPVSAQRASVAMGWVLPPPNGGRDSALRTRPDTSPGRMRFSAALTDSHGHSRASVWHSTSCVLPTPGSRRDDTSHSATTDQRPPAKPPPAPRSAAPARLSHRR